MSATLLWILAAILVIVGIVQLIQGQIILGIVLIVAGCLVGPGGVQPVPKSRLRRQIGGGPRQMMTVVRPSSSARERRARDPIQRLLCSLK